MNPQAWGPSPELAASAPPSAAPFLQLGRVQDTGCRQYSEGVYSVLFYIGLCVITNIHSLISTILR